MIRAVAFLVCLTAAGCSNSSAEGPETLLRVAMVEDQNCVGTSSAYLQNTSRKHVVRALLEETVTIGEGEPVKRHRTFTSNTGAKQFLGCAESPAGEGTQKKDWTIKAADYLT